MPHRSVMVRFWTAVTALEIMDSHRRRGRTSKIDGDPKRRAQLIGPRVSLAYGRVRVVYSGEHTCFPEFRSCLLFRDEGQLNGYTKEPKTRTHKLLVRSG